MNRRLALATVAVVALIGLAGCTALFSGISDEDLDRDQEYDDLREENATVAVDIEGGGILSSGEFRAVYDLNETDELSMYQEGFYSDSALNIHSVRYWYPDNGTELTGSELEIDQGDTSTDVVVPDGNGTLAISGPSDRNSFQLPAYVEGSYVVYLPEDQRTSNFLFGSASPSGYDREIVDSQERLSWEQLDSTISLQYYTAGNVAIFLGVAGVLVVFGGAGALYYYRQMKRLREQREELGLDVDLDDDGDEPPPGLK
ncbi:DUF5803 family protein [Halobacteria archaeon AArc-dxtr1]|nr:DUF5803 family protein [Halobacteria archaeon AArc-dxtr1]